MSRPVALRALAAALLVLFASPALADRSQPGLHPGAWSGDGGAPDFYRWTAVLPARPGVKWAR